MMKRTLKLSAAALLALSAFASTAFAGTWKQEANGWQYKDDRAAILRDGWYWLDGNNDGISECYSFDGDGYLRTDTTTPDGYTVNSDGAWTVDGKVQQKFSGPSGISAEMEQSGDQLYAFASAQTNALNAISAHATFDMEMILPYDYGSLPIALDMQIKIKDADKDSMKCLIDMRSNTLGRQMDSTSFYTDGWYYTEVYGQKIKQRKVAKDVTASSKKNLNSFSISPSDFGSSTVQKRSDGTRLIHYTSDTGAFTQQLLDFYEECGISIEQLGIQSISVPRMEGNATVNSAGYLVSEDMDTQIVMMVDGAPITTNLFVRVTYDHPNEDFELTLPSTDGYQELIGVKDGQTNSGVNQ